MRTLTSDKESTTKSFGRQQVLPVPKLIILASFAAIAAAEAVFAYGSSTLGLGLALFTVIASYLAISFIKLPQEAADCVQSLALVPIYILLTASLPWFFVNRDLVLPAVYLVVLALCAWHMYEKRLSLRDVGLKFSGQLSYMAWGAVAAIPLGAIEFAILPQYRPASTFQFAYFLRDLIYMLFFVGLAEEVLFRGILQGRFIRVFGRNFGLFLAMSLFGIMHMTWHSWLEVGFTAAIGLLLGLVYLRSGSLAGPIVIHGVANVVLVSVMPYFIG